MIALPVSKKNSTPKQTILTDDSTQNTEEIQSSLERRLQNILENVEGVGEVKVMLMTEEQQGIYRFGETEVRGVLIAAEGASDPVVVQKIQQAVMALFQIEAHKIKIMKMFFKNPLQNAGKQVKSMLCGLLIERFKAFKSKKKRNG